MIMILTIALIKTNYVNCSSSNNNNNNNNYYYYYYYY